MESYCYIIYSQKLARFYTGACREDLAGRILHHNAHSYGNHRFTAAATDWELFLAIPVKDYSHAIRLERLIKGMKSAKYIRNLKKYPELVAKIVNETSKDSPERALFRLWFKRLLFDESNVVFCCYFFFP